MIIAGEKKVGVMTYIQQGPGALDYLPYRFGASRLLFRGPRRDLEAPYVAFIGGTQTFGKFIAQPYPLKVEHLTGVTSVNLGQLNAGLDVFAGEPIVCELASNARVTVLEVLGAANLSNLYYTVHPRRNDRFLKASAQLESLYPTVDFTQFNFTQHMLGHLWTMDAERFELVKRMLQRVWLKRMQQLIERLGKRVILLGLETSLESQNKNTARGPAFVTDEMLRALSGLIDAYLEVSCDAIDESARREGMVYTSFQEAAARTLQGPAFHTEIANKLRPVLDRLM